MSHAAPAPSPNSRENFSRFDRLVGSSVGVVVWRYVSVGGGTREVTFHEMSMNSSRRRNVCVVLLY